MLQRIHFRRSIKEVVPLRGLIVFEIIVGGEFNEPILSSLAEKDVKIALHCLKESQNFIDKSIMETYTLAIVRSFEVKKGSIYKISVSPPSTEGMYCLTVSVSNMPILPVISGPFSVIDTVDDLNLNASSIFIQPLLYNFRDISFGNCSLYIREEYGASLGSHLYDSSIALADYCSEPSNSMNEQFFGSRILELGAGCGLVGIFVASMLASSRLPILLTDKRCQMSLLEYNIRLNNAQERCSAFELDWDSEDDYRNLQREMRALWASDDKDTDKKVVVDTIIATDVLYDHGIVNVFFNLVRKLGTAGITKLLLAQKIRGEDSVNVSNIPGVKSVSRIHENKDAAVIIWLVEL